MSVIPAFGRPRQEDVSEFKTSLSCKVRPYLIFKYKIKQKTVPKTRLNYYTAL